MISESVKEDFQPPVQTADLAEKAGIIGTDIQARVTFIAADGTVLGDNWEDPANMENHAGRPEVIAALESGFGQSVRYSTTTGLDTMYIALPVDSYGVVRVALPVTTINTAISNTIRTIVLTIVIVTLLIVVAASFITRMITQSTRQVTRAAVRIAAGQYDHTININSNDELGSLGNAFNKMSSNLKNTMADISNERNKLSTVLYTLTDGVMITDIHSQLVMANPAAEAMFNFKEKEAAGQPLIEVTYNHVIENLLKQCLTTLQKQSAEVDTTSGRFLRVFVVPLKTETLTGAVILLQDLTELRSLQTMRRQFVGNISHELKTPLAGIKAVIETLQDGALNEPSTALDFLKKAEVEVDSMTQLINELIELTRIETGAAQLEKVSLNLNTLVNETVNRLGTQAERKQIKITTAFQPDLPEVQADRERLLQVVGNILHNAIKFTPQNGQIQISTAVKNGSVVTLIKDTGIGISKEDLRHIFERFFKADKSRTFEGSGLGLAIAKHIIQAHNGKIWVESTEGQGSTFGFSLPVKS